MRFGQGTPQIELSRFHALCGEAVPLCAVFGLTVDEIGFGTARGRLPADPLHLRPGGTLSGPAQMALADLSVYAALLGVIGEVQLAVTTSLSINFLRKPALADLLADARLLKCGKRLAVGEVLVYSEGQEDPVAHATATYSIPPGPLGPSGPPGAQAERAKE